MARKRSELSEKVIKACREHMIQNGAADWTAVANQFPEVPRSTFFRLVEEARQGFEETVVTKQPPKKLSDARRQIRKVVETPAGVRDKIKTHLPVAPSPAVIASMDGGRRAQAFEFMEYFHRTVHDAELVRQRAVTIGPDGQEKVINPGLLNTSVRTRLHVLDTYLNAMNEFYNLEKLKQLYRVVIEEVGLASPEAQEAILVRLRKLNKDIGLTMLN